MPKLDKYKKDFLNSLTVSVNLLTEEQIKTADYIKKNYKKVSYMNLSEFSEKLKLEPSVIEGYLKIVGFNDYEDFRKALRKTITVELKTTDRFQISMEVNPKINNIFNQVINKEIQNLNNMMKMFDENTFSRIIEEVLNAPEVIVVGTRASATIAIYAEFILNRIGKRAKKIISGGTENFDTLATVDRNALVIAFGFARYPKETVKILNFFKRRNFKIISITDNSSSPLAPFSDIVFAAPCESISFTDFFGVPICLVNTIAISIGQLDEETTLKHLNEFEDIAKDMGFYF